MTVTCIGTPISWLRLERYVLGELPRPARRDVERHLEHCDACRACLEFAGRSHGTPPVPIREVRSSPRWPLLLSAAAVVLGALLVLLRSPAELAIPVTPQGRVAIKGGELALSLVRERSGRQTEQPTRFAAGDRFRALVTCPPGDARPTELVVVQNGELYLPLASATLDCGNRVPLPGAFRLSGRKRATICVLLDPPSRKALTTEVLARSSTPHVCVALDPE